MRPFAALGGRFKLPAMSRKRLAAANIASWCIAGLVALVGLALVVYQAQKHSGDLIQNPYAPHLTTATVTKTTTQPKTVTTTTEKDENGSGRAVTTEVRRSAGPTTDRTVTRAPVNDSVLERSVAGGLIVLLQIGIVVLAAFLAGAAAQRIVLARYAVKIGTLEIGDLPEAADASNKAIQDLRQSFEAQLDVVKTQVADKLDADYRGTELALSTAADALRALAELDARVRSLEDRPA